MPGPLRLLSSRAVSCPGTTHLSVSRADLQYALRKYASFGLTRFFREVDVSCVVAARCEAASVARQVRIEYAGAAYHVMARGACREPIFVDDKDRSAFLGKLGEACGRTGWRVHAYALMGNHYHLVKAGESGYTPQELVKGECMGKALL